jgi:hypothetical protein
MMNYKVDEYIEQLNEENKGVANFIRQRLHALIPSVEERFSFKIPFYHYFGMFCYINKVKGGIELCFCRGRELSEMYELLDLKKRKMIAGITFNGLKDDKLAMVDVLISGAAMLHEEKFKKNNRSFKVRSV